MDKYLLRALVASIKENDLVNIYELGARVGKMIEEEEDEPAFPCPSSLHGHPFNGLSKKEWFAAHAPTEIPAWFGPIIGETIGIRFDSQATFLKWRQWYGEQMAELFNK